ncbi:MAG TPA: DcrB-related protein [bacterium]|nr:DcrB-related protein [bacterium]
MILAVILWAGGVVAAGAQPPGMQVAADPKGRFTISFPPGWKVLKPENNLPAVIGVAPDAPGGFHTNVNVVVENLPREFSAKGFADLSEPALRTMFHAFTIVDQGPAKIAGRGAYYRYFTWEPNRGGVLYQVQAYFAVGAKGFVLTGTTLNDDTRIHRDFTMISRIFETFRPASSRAPATSPLAGHPL